MSDSERIEQLERSLKALTEKVEAMRENINANFDGHARVLDRVTRKIGIREKFSFKTGCDVARGS